jgi:uncharacterized coiled-coil protein SlyX
MEWLAENTRDAEMFRRIYLSPLDVAHADGDESLVQLVQRHNAALAELTGRFAKLADDRQALANPDRWLGHDSAAIVAERRRAVAESWDALLALRKLLHERQEVLRKLEDHVAARLPGLEEQRERALDKARKALTREHRDYLKAEPLRGKAFVEGLAEEDDTVAELRRQVVALTEVVQRLQTQRHQAGAHTPVTIRQREVIAHLN